VQDTAYQSLLKSTRKNYHQQIALVLEERSPEMKETQPELLAHHYTEAGLIEQAIPYWQQAGQRAVERSANIEAVTHLTKGLALVKTLPDVPERVRQELTLQLALGTALMAIKGFSAPEVEETVLRARELCQQLGETPQLFPVLVRLYAFYQNRGELQTTREVAEQMLRLAQSVQDRHLLSAAHMALGGTLYWLGELPPAQRHLEQALALHDDPQQHPRRTAVTADPRVQSLYYAARTLWHLGYPDQALERSNEAVAVAEGLSHPFSLAQAWGFAAGLHSSRQEWQIARERAEAVMTLSTEQGFPFWLAHGTIIRGGVLAEQGQGEEGIAQMQRSLAACRDMGAELVLISHLPRLVAAYTKTGQVEEGLSVVAEALTLVEKNGERFCEAELYRLKGELTLQKFRRVGNAHPTEESEAEACFLKAIEIAHKQQAKSWELRATMSLARLWQQQRKKQEAHQVLSAIYGWFTEGFDTKDLQEAKALLDEWARDA
jgi:predicted ATPase